MRCEFPEVTRCCFCFPLRLGLLVWAYIKIISTSIFFCFLMFVTVDDCRRYCKHSTTDIFIFHIPALTVLFVDTIFHIVFIVSAHQKELNKMRIFYKYTIVMTVLFVLGFITTVAFMFSDSYFFILLFIGFFQIALLMWLIVIQIYIIILVRSEIVKLERSSNFEFTNQTAVGDADFTTAVDLEQQLAY